MVPVTDDDRCKQPGLKTSKFFAFVRNYIHIDSGQETVTRRSEEHQPYIPVTAFSEAELFVD